MHVVYQFALTDGREVSIRARFAATTGEHLAWALALCHGPDLVLHVVDYTHRFTDSVVIDGHKGTLDEVAKSGGFERLLSLGELIATKRTLPKDFLAQFTRWWTAIYGAYNYDPKKAERPCECRHCVDGADRDETCLFFGIDATAQLLGSYDWELARECWALPVEVYQMLLAQRRERTLGDAADRQARDAEAAQRKLASQVNNPQSWASAQLQRERVLEQRRRTQGGERG